MTDASNKHLSFKERELIILREVVDKIDEEKGRELMNTPEVKHIVTILEAFLRKKKLICYGGTAINNILPKADQFYDRNLQIPDYDFFSKTPVKDAKELANIYAKNGFDNVEAKAGVHFGTYKVFVNFIPIADITLLDTRLFDNLMKESIRVNGIYYAAPNYLRMGMYLELSRPAGDTSRWEKVLKRLILLNKNYPLKAKDCSSLSSSTSSFSSYSFQRQTETFDKQKTSKIYDITLNTLIDQDVVFFGGYALNLFSKYMPTKYRTNILGDKNKSKSKNINKITNAKQPDFDVISLEPKLTATLLAEQLKTGGFKSIKIVKHDAIGEIIPEHYEVRINKETVVFIYKPIACHSFNEIKIDRKTIKVASIDTILNLYLAFLYAGKKYYNNNRLLCMASFLFDVQRHNRLSQKGLLKRFPSDCYGEQHTIDSIRTEKAAMWDKLKNKRNSAEYEMWFLSYKPTDKNKDKTRKQYIKKKSHNTRSNRNNSINNRNSSSSNFTIVKSGNDYTRSNSKSAKLSNSTTMSKTISVKKKKKTQKNRIMKISHAEANRNIMTNRARFF